LSTARKEASEELGDESPVADSFCEAAGIDAAGIDMDPPIMDPPIMDPPVMDPPIA